MFSNKIVIPSVLALIGVTPIWASPQLYSYATVPASYSNPPPSPFWTTVYRDDNKPAKAQVEAGEYYASAFAHSDYGVLRASVTSWVGINNMPIYRNNSGTTTGFSDDLFVNAPAWATLARFVFNLHVAQTFSTTDIDGDNELYFAATAISRPQSGVGLIGFAHCGTGGVGAPGINYGGSYGSVFGLNIPLKDTCTLDVNVTPGATNKIEIGAFLVLSVLGSRVPEALDATNTAKLISTGWVDSKSNFTSAAFTGESGTTYPIASGAVPEPASGLLAASCLAALVLRRHRGSR